MMTLFRWILVFVDVVIALTIAVAGIGIGAGLITADHAQQALAWTFVAEDQAILFWHRVFIAVGLYLILAHTLYAVFSLFMSRYDTHFRFRANNLDVTIALSAVEESLRRSVKKLGEIYDVWIRIYKEKGRDDQPLRIFAGYSTFEGTNIKEVTQKIREVIRLRFQEIIDIQQEPEFEIALTKIVAKDARKAESRKVKAEVEPDFRGPQYPTDYEYPS